MAPGTGVFALRTPGRPPSVWKRVPAPPADTRRPARGLLPPAPAREPGPARPRAPTLRRVSLGLRQASQSRLSDGHKPAQASKLDDLGAPLSEAGLKSGGWCSMGFTPFVSQGEAPGFEPRPDWVAAGTAGSGWDGVSVSSPL